MTDLIAFLKSNLADHFVIYFLPLYILGGRPAAVLTAQLTGYNMFFILPVVVLLDILQVPFFYHLYGSLSGSRIIKRLRERFSKKEKRLRESRFFSWMQVIGVPGVVAITLIPMKGCGMWSGVLLSKFLELPKKRSYPLLLLGSVLGCVFLLGIGEMILQFLNLLT